MLALSPYFSASRRPYMKRNGMTAMPSGRSLVLAKPADNPMTITYEHSIPAVDVRNRGRRPALSQFTAAVAARIRFHRASSKSVMASKRLTDELTKAHVDQCNLDRGGNSNRLENRCEITRWSVDVTLRSPYHEPTNSLGDDTVAHPVQGACHGHERSQSPPIPWRPHKIQQARVLLELLFLYHFTDLLHLELHKGIVLVAIGVQLRKDLASLLFPVVLYEPLDGSVSICGRLPSS